MKKKKDKERWMATKLDMNKAFNRVEWKFLARVMENCGFDKRWIDLIMVCVATVSYRLKFNGTKGENIRPENPLSPYLFIMLMEAFLGGVRRWRWQMVLKVSKLLI